MKSHEKTARNPAPPAHEAGAGVRLTSLTVAQVSQVLSAAGGRRITEAMVHADIDAGAPVNADGTINLVHYTAWLVREITKAGPVMAKPEAKTDGD